MAIAARPEAAKMLLKDAAPAVTGTGMLLEVPLLPLLLLLVPFPPAALEPAMPMGPEDPEPEPEPEPEPVLPDSPMPMSDPESEPEDPGLEEPAALLPAPFAPDPPFDPEGPEPGLEPEPEPPLFAPDPLPLPFSPPPGAGAAPVGLAPPPPPPPLPPPGAATVTVAVTVMSVAVTPLPWMTTVGGTPVGWAPGQVMTISGPEGLPHESQVTVVTTKPAGMGGGR